MEIIADLDFEPETELDNSFRNSRNGDYYYRYLGEKDIDELNCVYWGLVYGTVDKHEAYTYLKDKYGASCKNVPLMISYMSGIMLDLIESENNNPYQLEQLV